MIYFAAFAVTFLQIFLKATQQRHVQFAEYGRMPLVSMSMAFCEVFLFGSVVYTFINAGLPQLFLLAVAMGLGGTLGSMLGTWLHERRIKALPDAAK